MVDTEQITLRFMSVDDLDEVMEVERDAFPAPWDESIFIQEMTSNKFAHYLVYEYMGRVIGFCGLWIVMDEAQVTNIAIHSDYRGKGLGESLLSSVISYLKEFDVKHLSLEVRVSNVAARGLYRKMGFQEGGIRKNYYADNLEDALVMWVSIHDEAK